MTVTAALICATLVTNVGNGSVVTRTCVEPLPQVTMASPRDFAPFPKDEPALKNVTEIKMDSGVVKEEFGAPNFATPNAATAAPLAEADVAPPVVTAKATKPKRKKYARSSQQRNKYKVSRRFQVLPTVAAVTLPAKKPNVWQRLREWTSDALVNR